MHKRTAMEIYFDESIFDDGFSFSNYSIIVTGNRADRMLVERLNRDHTVLEYSCADLKNATINHDEVVNINPKVPCVGTNVYTMNAENKRITVSLPYHLITVTMSNNDDNDDDNKNSNENFTKLEIYPYDDRAYRKFDMNDSLTSFESAIMIKYLAMNRPITISIKLFIYVNRHFATDHRKWFVFDETIGIVENRNHDLLLHLQPVNLPKMLNISSPELSFV